MSNFIKQNPAVHGGSIKTLLIVITVIVVGYFALRPSKHAEAPHADISLVATNVAKGNPMQSPNDEKLAKAAFADGVLVSGAVLSEKIRAGAQTINQADLLKLSWERSDIRKHCVNTNYP